MKNGDASGYTLDDIGQMARELKTETEASERSPLCALDPGFYASFWVYPIAEALSILGWYHMQLGLCCLDRVVSGEEEDLDPASADDFEKSAQYYIQAADKYPSDDEQRPYMLAVAVEALWWSGAPLRDTLPLCRRVQAAMPEAAGIWERSQMGRGGNPICKSAVEFLASTERQLAEGTATLDEALMPADLMERRAGMIAHIQEG
ncbi:hypothetical protein B0H14DRAFT_399752 [Mycena olivaceomarginata]|nr:hypothetical protein B0H14DRAFT_399752 [Mycena olivaceomarginata]